VRRPRPLLAATLIVRDEAERLPGCLASLAGVVDEVVVYDTGSRDGTPDVARRAGARVLIGHWDDDFSRARNAARAMTRARWSLSVDADERLIADARTLRELLRRGPAGDPSHPVDAMTLVTTHVGPDGAVQARQTVTRLFRSGLAHWEGRVHEALLLRREGAVRCHLPPDVARLEHVGYTDPATVRAKAGRNLALAQTELDELVGAGSQDRAAGGRVLLHLARSALELDRLQMAVDALETLREIVQQGPYRTVATALLAQILLDAGGLERAALVLEAELRADPRADPVVVDWLRAQALAALGEPDVALEILRHVGRLVDASGVALPYGRVLPLRAALAARTGRVDEARACQLAAMTTHGAAAGGGELLLQMYAGDAAALVAALRQLGPRRAAPVLAELAQLGAAGAAVIAGASRRADVSRGSDAPSGSASTAPMSRA
jgi:tetratricopeptide (TPR) repeat protein